MFVLYETIDEYSGHYTLGVYSTKEKTEDALEKYLSDRINRHPEDRRLPQPQKDELITCLRKNLWFREYVLDDPAKNIYW